MVSSAVNMLWFSMVWFGFDGFWYRLLNDVADLVHCLRPLSVERQSHRRQCKNVVIWKIYLWMDFAAGVLYHWGPAPYTLPITHCISVYSILTHTGKEGGGEELNQREGKREQFTKLGRKYQHDWLYLQSINSDKHLPRSPFTGQFFRCLFS